MRIKDLATRATKLLTGNAWFVVDNGTKVEKAAFSEVVKQGIEEYAGSTLAGSAQTVKSAIDALNGKTKAYDYTAQSGSFLDWVSSTFTTNGEYYVVIATLNSVGLPRSSTGIATVTKRNSDIFIHVVYGSKDEYITTYVSNAWTEWTKYPTRAEMNAATVKTLTITATADANGYIDTGLNYNQAVPLCVYSVTIDGSAAYPFLYEFLMRGGSPAEKIAVRIKRWNGEIYTGEITFSMKYI